eukprot:m.52577 g.52577  ORF g.52577 m.52577 type:complete len:283 (+) comp21632_c0_seq2:126-974(+)
MAKSRYEYVKHFESDPPLLPNTFLMVRIDGRAFTKFTAAHKFQKPNDARALRLMNDAGTACMNEFQDMVLAFGQSDEYSFVFKKTCNLWARRPSKILSAVVSYFSTVYAMQWSKYMVDEETGKPQEILYPPQFDGRIVCYPSLKNIRDYMSWRQADCHINNLFNTCFWTLVNLGKMTNKDAEKELSGTVSKEKNELLFSRFNINYNNENPMFRKGSVLFRQIVQPKEKPKQPEQIDSEKQPQKISPPRQRYAVVTTHIDVIGDEFWNNPECPVQDSDGAGKR